MEITKRLLKKDINQQIFFIREQKGHVWMN
jgi:hypothetical protein